ncbi:TetR/AcrR family transcriptional regulator [Spirillospora sp. CA-253888]
MTAPQRAYRGRSAADRRDERRARLLAAGRDIWRDQGWAAVTVRGVCARAGLVDRYFYESFADRQALLLEIFDRAREELMAAVREAWTTAPDPVERRGRAAIAAVVGLLDRDPALARLLLAEPAGNPALEERRRAGFLWMVRQGAALVAADLGREPRRLETAMTFTLGGLVELLALRRSGDLDLDADTLTDRATEMFGAVLSTAAL